jgi:transposase
MNKNIRVPAVKKSVEPACGAADTGRGCGENLLERLRRSEAKREEARRRKGNGSEVTVKYYVGLDLGDRTSRYCFLDEGGEVVLEGGVKTTAEDLRAQFGGVPRCRIALEVGTHSPWIASLLEDCRHDVIVANPRKMESIRKKRRKNDRNDAETLARQVRSDVKTLYPIRHRRVEARQDLVLVKARDLLVASRTRMVNAVRGLVKSVGGRLPSRSAESFHATDAAAIPEGVREILLPLLEQIGLLTKQIGAYDRQVEALGKKYPETKQLRQVNGVGAITAVTYRLIVDDPDRFRKSRDVGPYLGLVPRQDDSGDQSPQLRITKTGDRMMRRLLVGSAQYMLGPFGKDSDLRRFGLAMAARGGKNAKRRAVVAVARKLAVLLHRLWVTGEVYDPLRESGRGVVAQAAR